MLIGIKKHMGKKNWEMIGTKQADSLLHTNFMGHTYFNMLWLKMFGMRYDCSGGCREDIIKDGNEWASVALQVWGLDKRPIIVSAMLDLWSLACGLTFNFCVSPTSIYDVHVAVELLGERMT